MALDQDTVSAFRKNRALTWSASKLWLFLLVVAAIGGLTIGDLGSRSPFKSWLLGLFFSFYLGLRLCALLSLSAHITVALHVVLSQCPAGHRLDRIQSGLKMALISTQNRVQIAV
jgi:CHASE2 domain-containing sensor protein